MDFVARAALVSGSATDIFFNFAVLVPFGFVTARAFPNRAIVSTAVVWLVAAVAVESFQLFLPRRFPALSDVVLNVFGASAGAWLYLRTRRRSRNDAETSDANAG